MTDKFLTELQNKIGPIGGSYLRPFVSDGDPRECPLVLLGYNPATSIQASSCTPSDFSNLLLDRGAFEEFYLKVRAERKAAEGKPGSRKMSTTRKRLGLFRNEFKEMRAVETNINAFPTRDIKELTNKPVDVVSAGLESARWIAYQLKPSLVICFGHEILNHIDSTYYSELLSLGPKRRIHDLVDYYSASWNNKATNVAIINRHLAARKPGNTDSLFVELAIIICREHQKNLGNRKPSNMPSKELPEVEIKRDPSIQKQEFIVWKPILLKQFAVYGSGKQESRDSYRFKTDEKRLFKIEGSSSKFVLSLMTKNYDVDQMRLSSELGGLLLTTRIKPKYIEVDVYTLDHVKLVLRSFMRYLPHSLASIVEI